MRYTNGYLNSLRESIMATVNSHKLRDTKILVTGATGLIGSAIVDVLCMAGLNVKIYAAGRSEYKICERFSYWKNEVQSIEYDVTKTTTFREKFDFIIHCASNAHPIVYSEKPVETIMTNVVGTNNLLKYAVKYGVKRVLYVSSSEVYGIKNDDVPYTENDYFSVDILNPRACYPSSKRICETLCSSYGKEFGLETVIVRPGHIYGPTATKMDSRAYAQFTRDAVNGRSIVMKSNGLQLRSYCYVMDCVSAILTVLTTGMIGEAYNISNKNSVVTIREFAETYANVAGCLVKFKNPNDIEKKGYNMMNFSVLNAEKLEKLGWSGKYDIIQGVKATIDSWEEF